MDSLRQEKASKIIESCPEPHTAMFTTKVRPQAAHPHGLNTSGLVTPALPWQSVSMPDNPSSEEFFPNTQPKLPLLQPEAVASCAIPCYLAEQTDPSWLQPPVREM